MADLIEVSKVYGRLSASEDDGVTAAIKSARDSATVQLSSLLNTAFEFVTAEEDTFFIDPDIESAVAKMYVLRLSHGFIKNAPMVKYSDTFEGLATATAESVALVSPDRGFVRVSAEKAENKYVRVVYDHGFGDSDTIPQWLQEAALGFTIKSLSQQQISDGKPELSNALPALDRHLSEILNPKLRVSSDAVLPLV